MTLDELREDIGIELARLDETLDEVRHILQHEKEAALTRSDVTAGATYLAQIYGGIENVLKRIARFLGAPLPSGQFWHAQLVALFHPGDGRDERLPAIVDEALFPPLTTLRKFRHVVAHGYAVTFERDVVLATMRLADTTLSRFKQHVLAFIEQAQDNV